MDKIHIVTGACGHLGNTVVKELLKKGERVRCLVMANDSSRALDGLGVELVRGDVRNLDSLDELFSGLEKFEIIVIHTAGIITISSKFDKNVYDVNVVGTANIIDKCKKYKVKRLIYVSSVHAIREKPMGEVISETRDFDPDFVVGLYAKTKSEATRSVIESGEDGLDFVIIHPTGIIGPNDYGKGHSTQLIVDFLEGRLTAIVNGGYDFVDVRDVAEGIISAVDNGKRGQCYILSNRFYSVVELLGMLAEVTDRKRIDMTIPLWLANLTAPIAELWYRLKKQTPLYTKYSLFTLSSNSNYSHEKADNDLNYSVRDMRDTLRDTVSFLEENNRVKKIKRAV